MHNEVHDDKKTSTFIVQHCHLDKKKEYKSISTQEAWLLQTCDIYL